MEATSQAHCDVRPSALLNGLGVTVGKRSQVHLGRLIGNYVHIKHDSLSTNNALRSGCSIIFPFAWFKEVTACPNPCAAVLGKHRDAGGGQGQRD